jgi:hypothetical protein
VDVGGLEVQELADLMRREVAELVDGVSRGGREWRGRSQKEPLPQDGLEALEVAEELDERRRRGACGRAFDGQKQV